MSVICLVETLLNVMAEQLRIMLLEITKIVEKLQQLNLLFSYQNDLTFSRSKSNEVQCLPRAV